MRIGRPAKNIRNPSLPLSITDLSEESAPMMEEILLGLQGRPKAISPKYLYDDRGSQLFDLISSMPEYYPTRTELFILGQYGGDILSMAGRDICLIELGAGACRKSKPLLETGEISVFVPVDISGEFLCNSVRSIADLFPSVLFRPVAMDFLHNLIRISPILPEENPRLILFAGSNIGNFDPADARNLLSQFHQLLRPGDSILIGYDLRKDPEVLNRAYNDSQGITAAFNRNLLNRLNRDLHANFNPRAFRHFAFYNSAKGRIEMHLESLTRQEVTIGSSRVLFDNGETLHTENSYKYTIDGFDALAAEAGFARVAVWTDSDSFFAVALCVPVRR